MARLLSDINSIDLLCNCPEADLIGLSEMRPYQESLRNWGKRDIIILAESSATKGVDTLGELSSNSGGKVAAELSAYDSPQLKLVKEFNPKCVVLKEAYDSLFSGVPAEKKSAEGKPAAGSSRKAAETVSVPEKEKIIPEKDDGDELNIADLEIDSIVTEFRSGAHGLLKKINLDHLMIEGKSGEENND